jgi:uncharacterized protein HemX
MPERARDIVELLVAAGGGAGITGFWAWLNGRRPGQAAIRGAAAQVQEALNKAAENTVAGLREEVDGLRQEIQRLEGELRQEQQRSLSLESILRKNGYDLSDATQPGAFTAIDPAAGTASVVPPRRRRKP